MAIKSTGAAALLLERILSEERDRSTLILCWLRVLLASTIAALVFPISEVAGVLEVWPVRFGALLYLCLATGVLLLAKVAPHRFMRLAAFAPAVIDVPVVGLIEWKQATYTTEPGLILAVSVAVLMGLVMVSSLALSKRVMVLVTPPALVFLWLIARAEGAPLPVRASLVVICAGFGPLGWVVVGKIQRLVRTSREGDLLGKYVLGPRVGFGGMAEVFKATYCPEGGFERSVAVKRILPQYAENPDTVALFRREAEIGARLAHPNVVQVLDFGADGSTYFLAMQYVDGVSLARVMEAAIARGRPLSIEAQLFIAHELAGALSYIHSRTTDEGLPRQLVHRDLNPPNVMISRIGEVKVTDFGIARGVDTRTLTKADVMRGKLSYAAPEQLTGEGLDSRVDLFALGVVLYEVATQQRLYSGLSELSIVELVLNRPTPPLSSRVPGLPAAYCATVDALLERDVGARLGSANEVLTRIADDIGARDALRRGREDLIAVVAASRATSP